MSALYPDKLRKMVVKVILGRGPGTQAGQNLMELFMRFDDVCDVNETVAVFNVIFSEDAVTDEQVQQVRVYPRRVHSNLGHPSNVCLQRMLREAKAHPLVIQMAGEFGCDLCKHRKGPAARLPASTVVHEPRKVSAWDCFHWTRPVTIQRWFAVIFADEGSRGYVTHVLKVGKLGDKLGTPSWSDIRAAFLSKWMVTRGRPVLVRLDPAGAFRATEFRRQLEDFGLGAAQNLP